MNISTNSLSSREKQQSSPNESVRQQSEANPTTPAEPYDGLAKVYDRMMAHVDYGHWSRFTADHLLRHKVTDNSTGNFHILETACGTGTLAMSLARLDLKIDAFDRSPGMIREAKRKTENLPNAPNFFVGTFEDFQGNPPYDAAICLYDSINYLLEPDQVIRFLQRIGGALKPGGIFLFDICTELNSVLHFNGRREKEAGPGYHYQRIMRYKHSNRIQENIFEIFFDGPPAEVVTEHHQQKIYSLDEIRSFITSAGLSLVEELDGYERKRPTSRSLRVHFLVRKPLR